MVPDEVVRITYLRLREFVDLVQECVWLQCSRLSSSLCLRTRTFAHLAGSTDVHAVALLLPLTRELGFFALMTGQPCFGIIMGAAPSRNKKAAWGPLH